MGSERDHNPIYPSPNKPTSMESLLAAWEYYPAPLIDISPEQTESLENVYSKLKNARILPIDSIQQVVDSCDLIQDQIGRPAAKALLPFIFTAGLAVKRELGNRYPETTDFNLGFNYLLHFDFDQTNFLGAFTQDEKLDLLAQGNFLIRTLGQNFNGKIANDSLAWAQRLTANRIPITRKITSILRRSPPLVDKTPFSRHLALTQKNWEYLNEKNGHWDDLNQYISVLSVQLATVFKSNPRGVGLQWSAEVPIVLKNFMSVISDRTFLHDENLQIEINPLCRLLQFLTNGYLAREISMPQEYINFVKYAIDKEHSRVQKLSPQQNISSHT